MVEKIGRRPILIFGAAGMVIMQFIVGAIGASAGKNTPEHPANPNATRAMIAFICLNISVFATTWGPAAWIVIGTSNMPELSHLLTCEQVKSSPLPSVRAVLVCPLLPIGTFALKPSIQNTNTNLYRFWNCIIVCPTYKHLHRIYY